MGIEISYIAPLVVPQGFRLSFQKSRRYDNGFPQGLTVEQALDYLEQEINEIGANSATIFSNFERLNVPRLRKQMDEDQAVALKIGLENKSFHIVSDTWYLIEANIYAMHLAIRSFKNLEKWGIMRAVRLMKPFDASAQEIIKEASDGKVSEWMIELGLGPTASLEDANIIYRRKAKELADDQEGLLKLNQAIEEARKVLG
ncbi:MAG: hypothetical protein MRY32_05420 [Rickettsiales bacterium]|nr:hypothetical protein [Rickettsiales bacterium]